MFLAIRDGLIVETSDNMDTLLTLDQTLYEITEWDGPLPPYDATTGEPRLDPRDAAHVADDAAKRYRKRRRREYPTLRIQLDMMYWDAINGTSTWVDEITRIKEKYPKPM
jgi:hypothetical protein